MATYNISVTTSSLSSVSPTTVTQNVAVGDTVNVTVNVTHGTAPRAWDEVSQIGVDSSPISGNAGTVAVLKSFTGASYTVVWRGYDFNDINRYGRVTGNITGATSTVLGVGTITRSPSGDLPSAYSPSVPISFTGTINQRYKIYSSPNDLVVGSVLGSTGTTSLSLSPALLPSPGVTSAYQLQVRKETAQGGDNIWYNTSPAAFTITRILAPTVNDSQNFDTTTNSSTIVHVTQLKAEGVGGTHEFAISNSATYNTGIIAGWQTSPTFTVTRGSSYYFWSRRSTESTDADGSTQQTVPAYSSPVAYGVQVFKSNGSVLLDTSSRIGRFLARGGPTSVAAGSSTGNISVPTLGSPDNSHVVVLFPVVGGASPYSVNVNYTSKTFTVTNNTSSSKTIYYYVVNSGEET